MDTTDSIPYSDSVALVNALTQGRGMPTGATAIGASKWYDDPRLAHIPYIQDIGALISGAHKQIPPTEGITPVEGIADPISNMAGMLAPVAKAYVGRQVVSSGKSPLFSVAGQRGSTGGSEGESTYDALKRMFLQRGGVESGQGKAIPSNVKSAKEMINAIKEMGEEVKADSIIKAQLKVAPKSIPEKGAKALKTYNNISKDILRLEYKERYGEISSKDLDRLWDHFTNIGAISKTPLKTNTSSYGLYSVNENAITAKYPHLFPTE